MWTVDLTVEIKLLFQNVFPPHENAKPSFSNSSGLKSVFEKLRFRDGLVWTVDLTVEIKLRFQNVFPPTLKPSFSNSSGLKSVFEKLCFRDG